MKKIILLFLLISNSVISQTTWFSQTSGLTKNFNAVFFINQTTGFIAGDSGTVLKTTNGGLNWFSQYAGSNVNNTKFNSLFFLDENTGYISGSNNPANGGKISKTTNGGINWNSDITTFYSLNTVFFTSATTGYSAGYSTIYKSINGGNSWSSIYNNVNFFLNDIYFTDLNTGYAVGYANGSSGIILKTTNSGLNWNIIDPLSAYRFNSIQFTNDSVGFIATDGGKILKTNNYGNNWITLSVLGTSDNFLSLFFTSEDNGFAVGIGSTIVGTTNGGSNWDSQLSSSIQPLTSVYFADGNTGYAVGNGGTIIKTTNGGGGILEPSIKLYPKILLEGIYNPFLNILSRKDTVTVYLRDAAVPYILRDSSKQVLDTLSYSNLFTFNNSLSSTYYIVAKHFNSIETWSKAGGKLLINNGTNYYYDFTSSKSQAYGNNLKLIGLKYAMYSGDVNRDGFINLTDLVEIYNNSVEFVTGYYLTNDLNADSVIDLTDITICYNNSINFIQIVKP